MVTALLLNARSAMSYRLDFGTYVRRLIAERDIPIAQLAKKLAKDSGNVYRDLYKFEKTGSHYIPDRSVVQKYIEALEQLNIDFDPIVLWEAAGYIPEGYSLKSSSNLPAEYSEIEAAIDSLGLSDADRAELYQSILRTVKLLSRARRED